MNLVLVFPPMAEPCQPYSSLPVLNAYLKARGWCSIHQLDINIQFVRYILNSKRIGEALIWIEKRLTQLEELKSLNNEESGEYGLLINASMKGPFVRVGIDSAVESLKDPDCYTDLSRLNSEKRLIREALEILSATTFPLTLSFANTPGPAFASLKELKIWVNDRRRNPFRRYFFENTLDELKNASPDLIGISITYHSQILAAFTLADIIKKNLDDVPIIFGGNIVSLWYDTIETCPELFRWGDYFIPFEGESSLHFLLKALSKDISLTQVPNLVYRYKGSVRKNPIIVEEIDTLPTPDYRGLPLELYLAPENVFLLYTSRGCYWSKCRFCSVSASMRKGYRIRNPNLIHNDIITLNQRHNAKYITFGDDCVSPATLKSLTAALKKQGPKIFWQCEVRFERELTLELLRDMREVGCLNLIFGLESYSPDVLVLMMKGIEHSQIDRTLEDCRRNGIAFNLQFFFGFPGEKEMDAELTADFIRKQAYGTATFSFGTFELHRGSPIEKNPEDYNINSSARSSCPLAIKYDYEPVSSHTWKIYSSLRKELSFKIKYSDVGLSITPHTLIFLHKAGFVAMGGLYQKYSGTEWKQKYSGSSLKESRLMPRKEQTIGVFAHAQECLNTGDLKGSRKKKESTLLYNYKLDRIVEISPILTWFLKEMDGKTILSELIDRLEVKIEGHVEGKDKIYPALLELYKKGFLFIPE